LYGGKQSGKLYRGLFRDYLAAWLLRTAENVRGSTWAGYRRMAQGHILPALGEMRVERMKPGDLSAFADLLKEKGLCAGTRHNILRLLLAVLRDGVSKGEVESALLNGFEVPAPERKKVPVLTKAEQKAVEETALSEKHGASVLLALYTGLRVGEICALKWRDVDFAEGVVHVRGTVQRVETPGGKAKTAVQAGLPKTAASERSVPVPKKLLEYLKALKRCSSSEYVVTCMGGMTEPRVLQYRFHALLKRAGVKRINFHALRHTYAVRCMELKMDVTTLSQLMGHASVKMTLDVYTDSLFEHKKAEVQALNGICRIGRLTA
jgi:integrase